MEDPRRNNMFKFPFSFFTVFFLTLVTILTLKHLAQLRTMNWVLCKENAALKKTVQDNLVKLDFVEQIISKEDAQEDDKTLMTLGLPRDDYVFQVQVVWFSPDVTPCHMGWLMDRLEQNIYGGQSNNKY